MTLPTHLASRDRSAIAHPSSPPSSVIGVLALVIPTVIAIIVAGATSIGAVATPAAKTALPTAARGPVSAAIGRDQAGYRVVHGRARNRAQGIAATFSTGGVTFAKGAARVRLGLAAYGRAGAERALAPAAPRAAANRVDYVHPGVREWWTNGPLGLEQGFDVPARPAGGRGPLTLSLATSGARTQAAGRSATLAGAFHYTGLIATDAHDHRLPASLSAGHGRLQIRVDDRNAAYPVRVDPFVQAGRLTASDGGTNDLFGTSVAMSGDTIAAMGQSSAAVGHTKPNTVYVFSRPASGWSNATQTARLTPADGDSTSSPTTVAVAGDTIVVGEDQGSFDKLARSGAALVFVKPPTGWQDAHETAVLTASDAVMDGQLGFDVATTGDTVVATTPNHDNLKGAAYVYTRPATGWKSATQTAVLTASDAAPADDLGAVAISGDTVVAASSQHAVGGHERQGAAYVFVKPAAGWKDATQNAELTASDGAKDDNLGGDAAIDGDTVVAGASNAGAGGKGAAYVFTKPAGGWKDTTQAAKLTTSTSGLELGSSVAVSGDRVLSAAFVATAVSHPPVGTLYAFDKPTTGWKDATESERIADPAGTDAPEIFGFAVALKGNVALAGVPLETVGSNTGQGAVDVLGVPPAIAIDTPADRATFAQGQAVTASYTCTPPAGTTTASCAGPVPSGGAVDTSTAGTHTFAVSSQDGEGITASRSTTYTVTPPPAPSASGGQPGSGTQTGTGTPAGNGGQPSGTAAAGGQAAAAGSQARLVSHVVLVRKHRATARLACAAGPCTGSIALVRKGRTLGSGRFRVADGATASVTLRLGSAAARLLAKHPTLNVTAAITASAGGTAARTTALVALRRGRAPKP